jgi:phosphopantothenoylcysteine decarboxylase/phosphopantothenate--cysteine ligase
MDFLNRRILIGICGSISAYKTAILVQELQRLGAEVRVVLTQNAQSFITPLTFQALTNQPACDDAMSHISWARWADTFLIAPASANFIAKMACGLADDLLSSLVLSATVPLIIAPAMNQAMWSNTATQHNIQILKQRGIAIIGPDVGIQACGEQGLGRLCEPEEIIQHLRLIPMNACLQDKHVVITAGGTQEAIDPVRYISNRSSGKMGYALARAAQRAGAKVTLISGKTHLSAPVGVTVVSVESAEDMFNAVKSHLPADIFIASAAVADYRVAMPAPQKLKKNQHTSLNLSLESNPDILAYVAQNKLSTYCVGFAAETDNLRTHAKQKLTQKNCDMIIANHVSTEKGFDKEDNQVHILTTEKIIDLPLIHKTRLAKEIIHQIGSRLKNRVFTPPQTTTTIF